MFVEHLDRLRTRLRPAGDLQRAFSQVWPQLSAPCRDELTRDAERYIRQPIPMWTACSMLKSGAQDESKCLACNGCYTIYRKRFVRCVQHTEEIEQFQMIPW